MPSQKQIREAILKGKGLRIDDTKKGKPPTDKLAIDNEVKNNSMLYIESLTKQKIEDIIWAGSVRVVSERIGVTSRTVSRWRVKFPK